MAERIRRRKKIEAPYPGLRPFLSGENLIFFGREGQSDELIARLRQNHFLAVLGSSGSGKSSLVRAGLQPDLESGLMAGVLPKWKIATMRPGDRPIANLVDELSLLVADPEDAAYQVISAKAMITTMLQASSYGLKEAALGPILQDDENLLVIVDQFEEIFRFNEEHNDPSKLDEAKTFMRLLLEASADPQVPIYVVITMRSDFLGECPRFDGIAEAINKGQYLVPRLSRAQMREAIVGPVAVFQAEIAPDLVIRILNDIGDNPDQLPILQHALMRTWDHHCPGDEIVLADYEEIGGLAHALNQHAEEIYAELERAGLGPLTQQLFKCLTEMEGDGKGIRRPAHLSEICAVTGAGEEQLKTIIEAFRAPGRTFLMPPAEVPLMADTVIDISHESFMRLWIRLAGWVREETQSADEYLRLSRAAIEYRLEKVNLWRQPELGIALKWRATASPTAAWASRYDNNFEAAMSFLDTSYSTWQKEEADKAAVFQLQLENERRAGANRRLRFGLVLLSVMLLGAVSLTWWALEQNHHAKVQRYYALEKTAIANHEAAKAKKQEHLAELKGLEVILLADSLRKKSDTLDIALGRVRGQKDSLDAKNALIRVKNDSLERRSRALLQSAKRLEEKNAILRQQKERQDSLRRVAEAARDTAESRNALLHALQLAEHSLEAPGTETAALLALRAYYLCQENGGNTNDPRIYDALHAALERTQPMIRYNLPIVPMAVDYDFVSGRCNMVTLGGDLGMLQKSEKFYFYDAMEAEQVLDIRWIGHGAGHETVLAASLDHQLLVYNSNDGSLRHKLAGHNATIAGAVEIPGKQLLLSCDIEGTVLLWNLAANPITSRALKRQFGAKYQAMALHSDGKLVAVGGANHILLYDMGSGDSPKEIKLEGDVTALAFQQEKRNLFFGMENGTVGYYDLNTGVKFYYQTHKSRVTGLAFSPNGRYLATSSYDQTLRLTETSRLLEPPIVLKGHNNWVVGLGFRADSQMLYSFSKDRSMRFWCTETKDLVALLENSGTRSEFNRQEIRQYNLPHSDLQGGNRK